MPRAKKKDPPKSETVTSKSKSGAKTAPKSSANHKSDDIDSEITRAKENSETVPTASGRSQRAAKSKPKAWEALIPKSRDTSLVNNSSLRSPVPVNPSQKSPVNPTSDKTAKPSRSRSTTKKTTKNAVPPQTDKTPIEPTVRQSRTVSAKGRTVNLSSETGESSRQSSKARNQKQGNTEELTVAKTVTGRQSRAVSAKNKTVTPPATVSRQSSRAKTKEKTVSPSPAKGKTTTSVPDKTEARQSYAKPKGKAAAAKDGTEANPVKTIVRQSSRARGSKDKNVSVESTSEKLKDSTEAQSAPVKKTSKSRGNKAKDSKVEEVSSTKVTKGKASKTKKNDSSINTKIDSFFKKTTPAKENIIQEPLEQVDQGKWKSFNNKSLSLKNKRLSKEVDVFDVVNNAASKKRKPSISSEEFDPTPTKKPAVRAPYRKVGFQSIAKSVAVNGEIIQKNGPRKTLCSLDILGLLDDGVEEVAVETAVEAEEPPEIIPVEIETIEVSNSPNNSVNKLKEKVPVWRKQADVSKIGGPVKSFDDVFNPENYGEEEFGPEDANPKKKRVRKKKKDTKAILIFGKNKTGSTLGKKEANEVKKAVKESHNLKTPGGVKKTRKAAIEAGKKLIQPIPNIFDNPTTSSKETQPPKPNNIITKVTYSSDFSHGAHNYFDSEIHQYDPAGDDFDNNDDNFDGPEPSEEVNRSGAFGVSLNIPSKNYKTPAIPKKISRLQTENSSTPNQKEPSKPLPVTIQEQIKCAFGFDDSEEDTDASSENESISISPVRKVSNPVLAMFENDSVLAGTGSSRLSTISGMTGSGVSSGIGGASRMSLMTGIGRLSSIQGSNLGANISRGHQIPIINKPPVPRKDGPFRVNLMPPKTISVESKLRAQVKALKEKEQLKKLAASKKKPSRMSPRKPMHSSTMNGDPIHSSTLLDFDRLEVPKPKNAYEMMQEASRDPRVKAKKLVKKVPKNPPALEQSSLFEDPPAPHVPEDLAKFSDNKNKSDNQKLSDKENSDANSPQKVVKPAVSRVYKRKSAVNNSTLSKPSVSFDQSIPMQKTPKKESKKEKAVKQWAQLQTSHFSEVEEFDLSFS